MLGFNGKTKNTKYETVHSCQLRTTQMDFKTIISFYQFNYNYIPIYNKLQPMQYITLRYITNYTMKEINCLIEQKKQT